MKRFNILVAVLILCAFGQHASAQNEKPVRIVKGGVICGKATSLPKPPYPKAAKKAKVSGAVAVEVLIGVDGKIETAVAVSGPPLLREAAVQAAKGASFSPTVLSGEPVKVSGVIVYNFVADDDKDQPKPKKKSPKIRKNL